MGWAERAGRTCGAGRTAGTRPACLAGRPRLSWRSCWACLSWRSWRSGSSRWPRWPGSARRPCGAGSPRRTRRASLTGRAGRACRPGRPRGACAARRGVGWAGGGSWGSGRSGGSLSALRSRRAGGAARAGRSGSSLRSWLTGLACFAGWSWDGGGGVRVDGVGGGRHRAAQQHAGDHEHDDRVTSLRGLRGRRGCHAPLASVTGRTLSAPPVSAGGVRR